MRNKSQAGVLVMPREAYEAVEGYDERFKIWGYEDNAFAEKLNKKWCPALRTSGDVVHLWHARGLDFDHPDIDVNRKLFEEIRDEKI
jgi:predicted glycosyltransferase involved in capsule biosynthesis